MTDTKRNSAHTVFLALGSNLGDRLANLLKAIHALPPGVQPIAESPVYETPPWGYIEQPWFLNQVLEAETDLSPEDLLAYLKQLEVRVGRQPTFHYGPRLIDIDILFYDNLVYQTPDLIIPHPHLGARTFVLVPLADLSPDLRHPISGLTVKEMLEMVDRGQITHYPSREIPAD